MVSSSEEEPSGGNDSEGGVRSRLGMKSKNNSKSRMKTRLRVGTFHMVNAIEKRTLKSAVKKKKND